MEACAAALGAESSGSKVSLRPYLSPASQSAGGGNVLGGGEGLLLGVVGRILAVRAGS